MRITVALALGIAISTGGIAEEDPKENFDHNARLLNRAILMLPPKFVGDVALEHRGDLLRLFALDTGRGRLDYGNGFLHYFVDGAAVHDSPSGSCAFWMKLLPRKDDLDLIFIHLAKPKSPKDQTFIFSCSKYSKWEDVTEKYLPDNFDPAWHLRPRRQQDVIAVARYEKYTWQGKELYKTGLQEAELIWNGDGFDFREVEPRKLPHIDLPPPQ